MAKKEVARKKEAKATAGSQVTIKDLMSGVKVEGKSCRLPIKKLEVDPLNPRCHITNDIDPAFAKNVAEYGIKQSLTVRIGSNGEYLVPDGRRRLLAARMSKGAVKDAPCILYENLSDIQVIMMMGPLNFTGKRMDPITRAEFISSSMNTAMAALGREPTSEEAELFFGLSIQTIQKYLTINTLSPVIKLGIREGGISSALAYLIASFPEEDRRSLWKEFQSISATFEKKYGKKLSAGAFDRELRKRRAEKIVREASSQSDSLEWYRTGERDEKVKPFPGTAKPNLRLAPKGRRTGASLQETAFRDLDVALGPVRKALLAFRKFSDSELSPSTIANLITEGRFGGVGTFSVLSRLEGLFENVDDLIVRMRTLGHDFGSVQEPGGREEN